MQKIIAISQTRIQGVGHPIPLPFKEFATIFFMSFYFKLIKKKMHFSVLRFIKQVHPKNEAIKIETKLAKIQDQCEDKSCQMLEIAETTMRKEAFFVHFNI